MKILPLFRLAMPLAALFVAAPIIRAQQFYDNNKWPSPNVVKLDDVPPALTPPVEGLALGVGDSMAKRQAEM